MKVLIPSPLRSYTNNKSIVDLQGKTLESLLSNLNEKFPGIRFRIIDEQEQIRTHIKIFVNQEQATSLSVPLANEDVVLIVCALSGG